MEKRTKSSMPAYKRFKNAIKKHDLFGYKIKFNYNQSEYDHKTLVGGIYSIIIKMLFFSYVCFLM